MSSSPVDRSPVVEKSSHNAVRTSHTSLAGKSLRVLLAMALVAMMGLVGQAVVAPNGMVRQAAAAGPVTSTNGGSYTVTSAVTPTTLPAGGGTVNVTYTVKNSTSDKYLWYVAGTNSLCSASPSGLTESTYSPGQFYLSPGQTATFTCSGPVTTTQDITANFGFEVADYYGRYINQTASLSDTVTVTDGTGGGASGTCENIWYSSFMRAYPDTNQIGALTSAATPVGTPFVLPDDIPSYYYWNEASRTYVSGWVTGSSALAIDPTTPNLGYFSGRVGNNFTDELFRIDLTTGEITSLGYAEGMNSNRYAVDANGTLWSINEDSGNLFELPQVSTLPTYPTGRTTANELTQVVNHGDPSVTLPDGSTIDFTQLTSGDIAFDGTGTMWILASVGSAADNTYLMTIGPAALQGQSPTATLVGPMGTPNDVGGVGTYYNGIAFGPDGTLYASSVDNASTTSAFYTINKDTGVPTLVRRASTVGGIGDLASCAVPSPRLQIAKTATPDSVGAGGTVTYTITIKNTGQISATGVSFVDQVPAGSTYVAGSTKLNGSTVPDVNGTTPYATEREVHGTQTTFPGVIPVGDTATVTFQVTMQPGQTKVCNQGTVADVSLPKGVLTDDPNLPGNDDPSCTSLAAPKVQIVKKINGDDANAAPGVPVNAGSSMSVSFEVRNTGNTALQDVTVTDDKIAAASIDCTLAGAAATSKNVVPLIPAGRSVTCTATYPAPAVGTQHTNTATVEGTPVTVDDKGTATPIPNVPKVTDDDPANAHSIGLEIKKQIKDLAGTWQDADTPEAAALVAAGAPMDIQFIVSNPSVVALTNVTVTDTATAPSVAATNIVCAPSTNNVIASLAAGASVTCTATASGPAIGQLHSDTGVASASPSPIPTSSSNPTPVQPTPVVVSNPANATPSPLPTPTFEVEKTVQGKANGTAGDAITIAADNTWTATYEVKVSNTSTTAGSTGAITDTPSVPTGFTITGATIDGTAVTPAAGPFQVSAGVDLGAQGSATESKTFVVVLSGTVDPASADWTKAGTCDLASGGDSTQGLFNKVSMPGDVNADNNDACVPVSEPKPQFSVNKTVNSPNGPLSLAAGQSTAEVAYQVQVMNNGTVTADSPTVMEEPTAPAGFTVSKVVLQDVGHLDPATNEWVQLPDQTLTAPYTIPSTKAMAPGSDQKWIVVVTYTVDQTAITPGGWTSLGTCDANDTATVGDPTKGLYNKVTMAGDSDAELANNNDACVPVVQSKMAVQKQVITDDPAVAYPVTINPGDTTATVKYRITVTNLDTVNPGTFEAPVDTPAVPNASFKVASVTAQEEARQVQRLANPIDTPVTDNGDGSWTIGKGTVPGGLPGDPGAPGGGTLMPGATKVYEVTVTYDVTPATMTATDWTNLGQCNANDTATVGDPKLGLYNKVTMVGDADPELANNNDACAPVVSFSTEKTTTQGMVTLDATQTSLPITYTVTVRNNSSVDATSPQVVDKPEAPAGFTIASVTVDGQPAVAGPNAGEYVVTTGDALTGTTPGNSKAHTVVVTYTVDQKAPTAADWTNLADCTMANGNATTPSTGGLFNTVSFPANATDTDGAANNVACVPVQPKSAFEVNKVVATGQASPITLAPGATTTDVAYTVSVKNSGAVTATSPQVVDVPAARPGFAVSKVTIGGVAAVAGPNPGEYVVTAPVSFTAGETKTYAVVVTYAIDQAAVTAAGGWTVLGTCNDGGANAVGDDQQGLYNKVVMTGDSDAETTGNNDACVPVLPSPTFKVAKTTTQGVTALALGQTTASATYQVTVTNNGPVAGTFPAVTDAPTAPAGFTISSVTVDGTVVTAPYTIVGEELAAGASKTYTVVVNYTVDQAAITAADGWTNLAACTNPSGGNATTPSTGGLFNEVTMPNATDDSDGAANNVACVPVTPPSEFAVSKTTTTPAITLAPGQTTATIGYSIVVTNTGATAAKSPVVTDVPPAPAGFAIASVTLNGATLTADANGAYTVSPGEVITPGTPALYPLVVTYTVDQSKILPAGSTPAAGQTSWTNLGTCATAGGVDTNDANTVGDPTLGLYNKVTMSGDSDATPANNNTPDANNDACTTITGTPQFAVAKTASTSQVVLAKGQTTASAAYTVTVSNVGLVDGTSNAVLDTPSVPAGFTIASVTVDGQAVTADANGAYRVTAGDTIAAKAAPVAHTVVVNYTVDQSKLVTGTPAAGQSSWTTLGTCSNASGVDANDTDTVGDKAPGLYNQVTMSGDSDGTTANNNTPAANNDACVPVTGASDFKVQKTTTDQAVTLATDQKTLDRTYTVTVTNTGSASGTSAAVTDTPSLPDGFTIASITVDGTKLAATTVPFEITPGDQLAAGASKDHTVVVTYAIDQTKITAASAALLTTCSTDANTPNKLQGLYNEVAMDGDNDGFPNNHVCTPVTPTPTFKVAKTTTQGVTALALGQTTASATYQVTVTNNGPVAGTFPAVTDAPTAPAGFTISSVTVDGTVVTAPYTIVGEELAAGASKTYTVVVNYTVDQAAITAADGWTNLAACTNPSGGNATTPSTGGLYNEVTMAGPGEVTDGSANNKACVPVTGEPQFAVAKAVSAGQLPVTLAKGATSATVSYTVTVRNTGTMQGTSAAVIDTPATPAGFTVASVTVDGGAAQTTAPYTVTTGDTLAAGAAKDHTVVVTYTVDQSKILPAGSTPAAGQTSWTNLGTCSDTSGVDTNNPDAVGNQAFGLANAVTMTGDSDGTPANGNKPEANNDACVPVNGASDFAVAKKAVAGQKVTLKQGQTSVTVNYEVTVSNKGTDQGTSQQVVDVPATWNGFTVASVVVDGGAAQTAAPFVVTTGDTLAAGASKTHTVAVAYTVDQSLIKPAGSTLAAGETSWSQLGTCSDASGNDTNNPETPGTQALGLANAVTMAGDGDGDPAKGITPEANNDACVPVEGEPKFTVAKAATTTSVALAVGQKTADVSYLVTVGNDGAKAGNSGVVTDSPALPAGFGIAKVVVDGVEATVTNGAFQVTAGDQLDPGKSIAHVVVVTYTVDQSKIVASNPAAGQTTWSQLGTCQAADGTNANDPIAVGGDTVGLYNKVTMTTDQDGDVAKGITPAANNDACVPVEGSPQFAVAKTAGTDKVTLAKDAKTAEATYTVTVANTGTKAGTFADIVDSPSTPAGFTVAKVTIDGVEATAPYTITGETLEPKATKAFTVVVTYDVDQALVKAPAAAGQPKNTTGWDALGTCSDASGVDANDPAKTGNPAQGLYNKVEMTGDSDGNPAVPGSSVTNNDACVPVVGTPEFEVNKTTTDKVVALPVGEDEFTRNYTVTVTNVGMFEGTSAAVTDIPSVPAGLSIVSVTIDGKVVQAVDGGYLVSSGDELAAGAKKTHQVVIVFSIDREAVDWDALGECSTEGSATDPEVGLYNKVTMGDDTDGPDNNDVCLPLFPTEPTASVKIVKYINGDDADSAPGVAVKAGSTMQITYKVTNTGEADLTDVKVTDDKVAAQDISCPKTELASGESMTCTASLVAPEAGVQHTNVGTVTAQPPADHDGKLPPKVRDDNPANAWVPSVKIVKSINGDDAEQAPGVQVKAGSTMEITYLVTNTGKGTLTHVVVTDDKVAATDISCPKVELAAGESMTCTATLVAPKAGEQHVNVGTVVGEPKVPNGPDGKPRKPGFSVTDTNKAHAHTPKAPVVNKPHEPLASTGAQVSLGLLGAGVVALVAGGALLGRRRKDEQ